MPFPRLLLFAASPLPRKDAKNTGGPLPPFPRSVPGHGLRLGGAPRCRGTAWEVPCKVELASGLIV
eukprot:16191164-Heterocapsa_arctica.AAC.1